MSLSLSTSIRHGIGIWYYLSGECVAFGDISAKDRGNLHADYETARHAAVETDRASKHAIPDRDGT